MVYIDKILHKLKLKPKIPSRTPNVKNIPLCRIKKKGGTFKMPLKGEQVYEKYVLKYTFRDKYSLGPMVTVGLHPLIHPMCILSIEPF